MNSSNQQTKYPTRSFRRRPYNFTAEQLNIRTRLAQQLQRNWFYIFAAFTTLIILSRISTVWAQVLLWLLFLLLVALAIFSVVLGLWIIPRWQISHIKNLDPRDFFALENEARKTIAQIFGGLLLLASFYFTWENLRTTQENTEKTRRMTQQAQISERLAKAIQQLNDQSTEVRLAGIYALGWIAKDYEEDDWPVMDILSVFIRKKAPLTNVSESESRLIEPDVQAAMRIIGQHKTNELQPINLYRVNLRGINLSSANLSGVNFEEANFKDANLAGANLANTNLKNVNLTNAILNEANLNGAYTEGAKLDNCSLRGANVIDVDLQSVSGLTWDQIRYARIYSTSYNPSNLPTELRNRWLEEIRTHTLE